MKRELVEAVANALSEQNSKNSGRYAPKLVYFPHMEDIAYAAIRAVMQTDEVRGLVEAARKVVRWVEPRDFDTNEYIIDLQKALSQLEQLYEHP